MTDFTLYFKEDRRAGNRRGYWWSPAATYTNTEPRRPIKFRTLAEARDFMWRSYGVKYVRRNETRKE